MQNHNQQKQIFLPQNSALCHRGGFTSLTPTVGKILLIPLCILDIHLFPPLQISWQKGAPALSFYAHPPPALVCCPFLCMVWPQKGWKWRKQWFGLGFFPGKNEKKPPNSTTVQHKGPGKAPNSSTPRDCAQRVPLVPSLNPFLGVLAP